MGMAVQEGKGGVGFRAGSGPKGTFRPYQLSEPQPRGAVTRRAVAQRRSRVSGLTRPLAEAIRGSWFSGFSLQGMGLILVFRSGRFMHSRRRSYYLFLLLFVFYLYG